MLRIVSRIPARRRNAGCWPRCRTASASFSSRSTSRPTKSPGRLSKAIGDSRKLTLRSFGIETAWDVKRHSILAVPGFGPALTGKLMDWRRSIEQRFRFNPNQPTDPAAIAKVHAEIALIRNNMETELLKAAGELETIKAEVLAKRRDPRPYQTAYQAFRQVEEDWRALN